MDKPYETNRESIKVNTIDNKSIEGFKDSVTSGECMTPLLQSELVSGTYKNQITSTKLKILDEEENQDKIESNLKAPISLGSGNVTP